MAKWMRVVAAAGIVVLLTADATYAWGAATHTKLALDALSQLALLPATLAALLGRHRASFIFGSCAADVVFAKRMSRVKQFCHHWSTPFDLLAKAVTDRDRAFACGYLAHLAADTVAHGKFVPRQLSLTRTTVNFGHIYWEMRADALLERRVWVAFEEVMAADHEHHHLVLAGQLTATLLPYHFNRRLFDRLNRLVARRYWQACVQAWHARSRWDLSRDLLAGYHAEALANILSVLADGERSPVLRLDPNGSAALHGARLLRREDRRLRLRGLPTERRRHEAAAALAPATHHLERLFIVRPG